MAQLLRTLRLRLLPDQMETRQPLPQTFAVKDIQKALVFRRNVTSPVVKGYRRSAVYDFQRSYYRLVPNDLADVVDKIDGLTPVQAFDEFRAVESEFKQYMELLIDREYIMLVESEMYDCFSELNVAFRTPSVITNAIIDLRSDTNVNFIQQCINLLAELRCYHIMLRWPSGTTLADIENVATKLDNTHLENVQFMYDEEWAEGIIGAQRLIDRWPWLAAIYLTNARAKEWGVEHNPVRSVVCITHGMNEIEVDRERMLVQQRLYNESQWHNTFANRKLHIDSNGSFANTPFSAKRWVINAEDLSVVVPTVHTEEFKVDWDVPKDRIDICRHCEHRHMCVDPVLPVKRNDGSYFRPRECAYNPYICKWRGEEGHRTLAECGVICNAEGFSIDHNRIVAINAELWGE